MSYTFEPIPISHDAFFTPELMLKLNKQRIPHHIAIIPDGNRRWAKQQHIDKATGHEAGAHNLIDIVLAAKEIGIKVITFYIFSTENWQRDQEEVQFLLWLLESWLVEKRPIFLEHNVRLNAIGDTSRFQKSILDTLDETKKITAHCSDIDMVIAINYGGRNEITRAMRAIYSDIDNNRLTIDQVNEDTMSKYLDTSKWKDPDLLIRTSGEMRISNFLIWQTSYTEVYIADTYWPDFTPTHLFDAVINFQKRDRRWGGA